MSKRITVIMILAAFALLSVNLIPAAAKDLASSKRAWLGVYLQNIDRDLKDALDLESKTGALIAGVVEDSPAEEAGIEEEDVIVGIDSEKVKDTTHLTKLIKKHSPGDKISLVLIRDGKEKKVTVTLGKEPKSEFGVPQSFFGGLGVPGTDIYGLTYSSGSRIGVKVQSLSEQLGNYFGVEDGEGALITEVEKDTPAEKAGMKAGDVIVEADGEKIEDTGDLVGIVSEKEEGDKVNITVMRDRTRKTFEVEVEEGSFWSSWKGDDPVKMKIFSDKLQYPQRLRLEKGLLQKESSQLEDEMEELREELDELKEELQELREKLK